MNVAPAGILPCLNVLVVAPAMPPSIGGAESIAEVLTLGLARTGDVTVHLVTSEHPRLVVQDEISAAGGTVNCLGSQFGPRDGFVGWEWATFARAEEIHSICERYDIDVIHAMSHDTLLDAAIAVAGSNCVKRPVIVGTLSEVSTNYSAFGLARSKFIFRQRIDGMLHLSDFYRLSAKQSGCTATHQIIAAAVDTSLFQSGDRVAKRKDLGLYENETMILCPSRFSPRKGQLELLAAVEKLREDTTEHLTLIFGGSVNSGSPAYLGDLTDRATSSAIRTRIIEIQRAEMPDFLAASDLVVFPSHFEGLGFAAIEAMCARRPVVVSEVSGFDEIPDAQGQLHFTKAADPDRLADDLQQLIDAPDYRANLADSGHERAIRAFSIAPFIHSAIMLYRTCIDVT